MSWLGLDLLNGESILTSRFISSNSNENAHENWDNDEDEVDDSNSSNAETMSRDHSSHHSEENASIETEEVTITQSIAENHQLPFSMVEPQTESVLSSYILHHNSNDSNTDENEHESLSEEGITILPSVGSGENEASAPLEVLAFSRNQMILGTGDHSERIDGSNGPSTNANVESLYNAAGAGSPMSSLSLHPSSVESSVMTEWSSIEGNELLRPGSPPQLSNNNNEGIEILPSVSSQDFGIGFDLEESNDSCNDSEETADQSKKDENSNPLSVDDDDDDDDDELESLSSSFLRELNRLRQESSSETDTARSNSEGDRKEPWYSGLETEKDWEAFRLHAKELLAAVNTQDSSESPDDLLARLILEEEALFWEKQEREGTLRKQSEHRWKIAAALATAAVASVGLKILRR